MNRKIIGAVCLLVGVMSFGACSSSAEETRTVEWYLTPANAAALDAKIRECKSNPGELWDTPNCVNARHAAERRILGGSFNKVQEPAIPDFSAPGNPK